MLVNAAVLVRAYM